MRAGRTVALIYRGHARIVWPESVTPTHLRGWCLHRHAHRQFRLDRIEALKVWQKIEHLGPEMGPPLEIEPMTMQLATRISAMVIDLQDMRASVDAMAPAKAGEFYDRLQDLKRLVREFADAGEDALLDYCLSGREPVVIREGEPHRLYAKADKTVKCRDVQATHAAILEQHGPAAVAGALASGAFKQAACKPLLGSDWPNHFEVIERAKLAEGGAPKLRLTVARNAEEIVDE